MKRIVATEKRQEQNLQSESEFSGVAEISSDLFDPRHLCVDFKT